MLKYHFITLNVHILGIFMLSLIVIRLQNLGELVRILGELTLGELVKNWASW